MNRDSVKIKKLIKELAKDNVFIVADHSDDKSNGAYDKLVQYGSPYDFLKIAMDNRNPVVRLYAFRAIAARMDNLPAELVLKFKEDTTMITVLSDGQEKKLPVNQVANGYLK